MHLITDENGNPIPHGEHEHEHHHEHHHEHGHEHCGACQETDPVKQTTALLSYMLTHNQSHAAELDQMAEKVRALGMDQAAEQIKKAVDEFQKGNLYLSLALSTVKEKQ